MTEWNQTDAISASPQRKWCVTMYPKGGNPLRVIVTASTIERVIDQVKARRIAPAVGMPEAPVEGVDFEVSEVIDGKR